MPSSLGSRLGTILTEEKYTDCSFMIGDQRIHGHRIILSAGSPVFEAMFYGPFSAANQVNLPVKIVDISPKIFRAMIKFIYTEKLDWDNFSNFDLLELYYCFDKYLIRNDEVTKWLRRNLNCNTIFLFYDFAIRFKVDTLLADCRELLQELLKKKPNLFFKKVLQIDCDRVIRDYCELEGLVPSFDERQVMGSKSQLPIQFIEDVVFRPGAESSLSDIGQYHQVSKECLNDQLLLNYDHHNGTFNENLLLYILKWTKIEWKLECHLHEKLQLEKVALQNYYSSFVCQKMVDPLVRNLLSFLETYCFLNEWRSSHGSIGWQLFQRIPIKAGHPLEHKNGVPFETKLRVNQSIVIKSLQIHSRQNNAILESRFIRPNTQLQYTERVTLQICGEGSEMIHRQLFDTDAEYNSEVELILNKSVTFNPGQIYALRFTWPDNQSGQHPQKIYEKYQRVVMADRQLGIEFVDEVANSQARGTDNRELIPVASILSGLSYIFI